MGSKLIFAEDTRDADALRVVLMLSFGYTVQEAEYTIQRLSSCTIEIRCAVTHWLATGEIRGPEVEGHTALSLYESRRVASPAAGFLTIDWLLRDPIDALESLSHAPCSVLPDTKNPRPRPHPSPAEMFVPPASSLLPFVA